jgi:hypothetical protein
MARLCATIFLLFAITASAQSTQSDAALARRIDSLLAAPELQ